MSFLFGNCPFSLSFFCFFFFLCLSLLVLADEFAENGQKDALNGQSQPKERRLRNRPRDFLSECVTGYRERIEFHCQFPNMDKPCLRENAEDSVHQLDVLAAECCASPRLCSVDDIESFCCRTMDCLALCYGDSFLAQIQSRFRYADILLKRHSSKGAEKRGRRTTEEEEEEKRDEEDDDDDE
ncbi:hypothetical protein niasHT_000052 [Heterodera trifolii]|uniref:Uncharacterized protein n=1 Tax=Heterodera trifolii TaxID=157864 RepID=A0ABD2MCR3_9BILA